MASFKAKMHSNRFLLGLCPRPHWGSLQRSPDPLAGFEGLLLRGWSGRKGRGEEGKGEGKGKEKREGQKGQKRGEGKGREGTLAGR